MKLEKNTYDDASSGTNNFLDIGCLTSVNQQTKLTGCSQMMLYKYQIKIRNAFRWFKIFTKVIAVTNVWVCSVSLREILKSTDIQMKRVILNDNKRKTDVYRMPLCAIPPTKPWPASWCDNYHINNPVTYPESCCDLRCV